MQNELENNGRESARTKPPEDIREDIYLESVKKIFVLVSIRLNGFKLNYTIPFNKISSKLRINLFLLNLIESINGNLLDIFSAKIYYKKMKKVEKKELVVDNQFYEFFRQYVKENVYNNGRQVPHPLHKIKIEFQRKINFRNKQIDNFFKTRFLSLMYINNILNKLQTEIQDSSAIDLIRIMSMHLKYLELVEDQINEIKQSMFDAYEYYFLEIEKLFLDTKNLIDSRIKSIKEVNNYNHKEIKNFKYETLKTIELVEKTENEDLTETLERKRKKIEGLLKLVMN